MKNLLRNLAYASVIVAALTFTVCQVVRPAQATPLPGRVIVGAYLGDPALPAIILDNGDVWRRWFGNAAPEYVGNFWGDQPINVSPSTWSNIKSKLGTPTGN